MCRKERRNRYIKSVNKEEFSKQFLLPSLQTLKYIVIFHKFSFNHSFFHKKLLIIIVNVITKKFIFIIRLLISDNKERCFVFL
jgi:hypothetical protein